MNESELKKFENKQVKLFLNSSHIFDGYIRIVREDTLDLIKVRPNQSPQLIKILNSAIASISEIDPKKDVHT